MGTESRRSEVVRHGCLRIDGVYPLIHPFQCDPSSVLTSVRGGGKGSDHTGTPFIFILLFLPREIRKKMMQTKHISQERKIIKLWWTWNDPHNDRKRVTASYPSLLIQTRSILLFCFRWLKRLSGCNDVCVQVRKNHSRATTASPMK